MVKVFRNDMSAAIHSDGSATITTRAQPVPAFTGTPYDAARYLQDCVPVGVSVEVRHPKGIRSCMNKPSLWPDVMDMTPGKEI